MSDTRQALEGLYRHLSDQRRKIARLERVERAAREAADSLWGADELRWLRMALDAASLDAAPDPLTRDEKISLRTAVGCLREDYPHAAGLPHAESALRKLRATQADTDAT